MMKCIIVDDEPLAREGMKMNISELSNLNLIGEFEDANSANEFLQKNDVDISYISKSLDPYIYSFSNCMVYIN